MAYTTSSLNSITGIPIPAESKRGEPTKSNVLPAGLVRTVRTDALSSAHDTHVIRIFDHKPVLACRVEAPHAARDHERTRLPFVRLPERRCRNAATILLTDLGTLPH
jgi:hypothetical protein